MRLVWNIRMWSLVFISPHIPLLLATISLWWVIMHDFAELLLLRFILWVMMNSLSRSESYRRSLGQSWQTRCRFNFSSKVIRWVGTRLNMCLVLASHLGIWQLIWLHGKWMRPNHSDQESEHVLSESICVMFIWNFITLYCDVMFNPILQFYPKESLCCCFCIVFSRLTYVIFYVAFSN